MEKLCSLLCGRTLIASQDFILTLALASEMFDPLLSNKCVCGGPRACVLCQAWLRDEKDHSVDIHGGRVGLAVSHREDRTVSGVYSR